MSYIASNDNRLYAAVETEYGQAAGVTEDSRFPAVRLSTKQVNERPVRRDKTGTRTYLGLPAGSRRRTSYALRAYLSGWSYESLQPGYGPLFEAALGDEPLRFAGGTVSALTGSTRVEFTSAHGLSAGQAVAIGGEMRFVSSIVSSKTVEVNAPFSLDVAGFPATPTITYRPSRDLKSVTLFDFWSPETFVQRIVTGAGVDELKLKVNGDFHEFEFRGPACDLLDSGTFVDGQGGLEEFPEEPPITSYVPTVVPGHLGQVWLGVTPQRFYTLTSAELMVRNHIEDRVREFGSDTLRGLIAGHREVLADFELYGADDEQSLALFQAARQRSPIQAMFQLGQQQGQLVGAYLKSLTPEVPDFDDSETRLIWRFNDCRAQGSGDDEIAIAFG
jgi:hypothetical protein